MTDERHPDNPAPSGPPTHWIDTNVLLEVYSHGDLYAAADLHKLGKAALADVESRRLRLQGSSWMAMALCRVEARSIGFQHENMRNILRIAPPNSQAGGWTSTILYMLGDHGVWDGWEKHVTNDGATLTNRQRDAFMVAECKSQRLVLVTRDEQVIGEAHAAGVDAVKPEPFASRHITLEDARSMFAQRLFDASMGYVVAGPPGEQELRMAAGRNAREVFAAIWHAEPWFK